MKKSPLSLVIVCLIAALGPQAMALQEIPEPRDDRIAAQVDRYVGQFLKDDEPGGAVIVVKDGEMIFRKAYGMANLELGVKMEPEMVFAIGSLTKQFTAAATVLLAEKGRLSLTDPISKYFPDFPGGGQIQIKPLLTHTSGI